MAAQRLSRRQKHILHWLAADHQRTRGMITRSHQDLVRALPGDKGNMSHSLQTLAARSLMVIGRSPGGKAESMWLTPEGQKWAAQLAGSCDEGEPDVAAMGYRACNSLYVAPAPLSAGGSSKMASKVRNRVRNVSQQVSHHARRRVWPWHSTRGKDAGTQTPTATPEGGRLHDSLCTCNSPCGAYTFLALERRLALLPTAEPPGVKRS